MALYNRKPGESARDFERFQTYLRMTPGSRELKSVAEAHGISYSRIMTVSANNSWKDRTAAYDGDKAKSFTDAQMAHQADLGKEHAEMWGKVRQLAMREILRRIEDPKSVLTERALLDYAKESFKGEQILAGKPTEITGTALDTQAMSTEEKRALRSLLAKAGAGG